MPVCFEAPRLPTCAPGCSQTGRTQSTRERPISRRQQQRGCNHWHYFLCIPKSSDHLLRIAAAQALSHSNNVRGSGYNTLTCTPFQTHPRTGVILYDHAADTWSLRDGEQTEHGLWASALTCIAPCTRCAALAAPATLAALAAESLESSRLPTIHSHENRASNCSVPRD